MRIPKKKKTCNICEKELKECLGHIGIHPFLCDSNYYSEASQKFMYSVTYDDYQKYITRKRAENE